MYGFNFGYDTRYMNTGDADNTIVTDKKDVSFQQVAFNFEAASKAIKSGHALNNELLRKIEKDKAYKIIEIV